MTISGRVLRRAAAFVLVVLICSVFTPWKWRGTPESGPLQAPKGHDVPKNVALFWREFSRILAEAGPRCSPPRRTVPAPHISFDHPDDSITRPDVLIMAPEEVTEMNQAHSWFVEQIAEHPPPLPFERGTRGIVTTAGGRYLPIAVVSLRMLRLTGSQLPVELWLLSWDEYEPDICEGVLRDMNVRCRVLSDVLETVPSRYNIAHFQVKILAIIFSTFDDVLFLDSDAILAQKPDSMFETEPFLSHKMVLWPDYFASTTSPFFYQISSTQAPPMFQSASIESGQLLVSKSNHATTLLLATYYNYFGPLYYYPLLNQGGPGEGDKDTFVEAARAMNKSYHLVSQGPLGLGFWEDGEYHANAMAQAVPSDDYTVNTLHSPIEGGLRRLTVHTTVWKLSAPGLPYMGRTARMWGDKEGTVDIFGRDIEKDAFEQVLFTACKLENNFSDWKHETGTCEKMRRHFRMVFEGASE